MHKFYVFLSICTRMIKYLPYLTLLCTYKYKHLKLGAGLSLPTVGHAMLWSNRYWVAMANFCETVISHGETTERARKNDVEGDPLRRRRGGLRRWRRYSRYLDHKIHGPFSIFRLKKSLQITIKLLINFSLMTWLC